MSNFSSNFHGTQDKSKKNDVLFMIRENLKKENTYSQEIPTEEISDEVSDHLMHFIKKHFEPLRQVESQGDDDTE